MRDPLVLGVSLVSHLRLTCKRSETLDLSTLSVHCETLMSLQGFAERLRAARAAAALTQGTVAAALGYSETTIANWEHDRSQPSPEDLARLVTLYRVSADWLLSGAPRLPHRFEGPKLSNAGRRMCPHDVPITDRCVPCEQDAAGDRRVSSA